MKKVLFLALGYADAESKPNLYTDLMTTFQKNGHETFVVAPALNNKNQTSIQKEMEVTVLRVPTLNLFGNGLIQKGLSNILLPYQYKRAIKKMGVKLGGFDLIIMPTPPITLISVAEWIKRKSSGKLYLILRDIFPQNAVDLNFMSKKGPAYIYFRYLEKKLYKTSDFIGCMSMENINYVKRHNDYLNYEKLHMLPNWEKFKDATVKSDHLNEVRNKYNLNDKVVAIYGGNMGLPQQLENILDLAESVQEIKDLVFLFIGWGTEKKKIIEIAESKNLQNVIFLNEVTRLEFSTILNIADIGLISLNKNFTIPNYPSKVNSYYKFKLPVLASVDENTDFGRDQEKIGCGFWSVAGDNDHLKSNLFKLYQSKKLREEMGLKGYNFMKENLTAQKAYENIIRQIS